MISDFIVNVQDLGAELPHVNIYPIGDTQFGSAGFDDELYEKWKKRVLADELSRVVVIGDMINNGLKTSKTNSYKERVQPFGQREMLIREFRQLKDKIIGAVTGNHELRSVNLVDLCPLYDAMLFNGIEDCYRENLNATKITLGNQGGNKRVAYVLVLHHGLGGKRAEDIGYQIEGSDVIITGHIHQPKSLFPARLVVDPYNNIVRKVSFKHIVVPSFDTAGYAIQGAYKTQSSNVIPIITLSGKEKNVKVTWEEL